MPKSKEIDTITKSDLTSILKTPRHGNDSEAPKMYTARVKTESVHLFA